MNYAKLTHNLRRKAYNYTGIKAIQFNRILKEAKSRKIKAYTQDDSYNKNYSDKQQRLLFRTN